MRAPITVDPYNPKVHPLLIVISGPSGVGKDAVVRRLQERGTPFYFVITATTRLPRPNEVHGVDYFFVSEAEFLALIEQDELLEHAVVYEQHKGIPKAQVRTALQSGQDVVMRLDVQGAATIKRLIPEAILIFITAASEEELVERLHQRKTESEEQLQRRIATARVEMLSLEGFDYVVVNRHCELDSAVDHILSIISAEHDRVHPRQVRL